MKAEFNENAILTRLEGFQGNLAFTNGISKSLDFVRVYVDPVNKKYVDAGYRHFEAVLEFDTNNTGIKSLLSALKKHGYEKVKEF